MSRPGSRYPSAFGHTPSYRSYAKGTLDSPTIGYNVNLPGTGSTGSYGTYSSGISRPGATSLGTLSLDSPPSLTAYSSYGPRDLATSSNYSGSNNISKVSKSSYSSVSDSTRDGGRPIVEYSDDTTYRSTATGPSGIPHSSYSHSSSSYSSEDPYRNRTKTYSYNI